MQELSDLAAERAVLAGIYKYGEDIYIDIAEFVSTNTFTDKTNQAIFNCFKELVDKRGVTQLDHSSVNSIANELGYKWLFENKDELSYLISIFKTNIIANNVKSLAVKIRKLEIARLLREQLSQADNELLEIKGIEPVDVILGIVENKIFDFSSLVSHTSDNPIKFGDNIKEYIDYCAENPTENVGTSSGWKSYDKAIGGGFRRGGISVIAARQKFGKSLACINIGLYVAGKLNIPVCYFDTEMQAIDHYPRLLANVNFQNGGTATIDDIETGKFNYNSINKIKVKEAAQYIKSIPLFYKSVAGIQFEEILSIIRRWLFKDVGFNKETGQSNDCLIIYDYIKLMNADDLTKGLSEFQLIGFLMSSLHNFAAKYNVPILAMVQQNREGILKETTGTISGSDRIGWLATNVSILKSKSPEEIAHDGVEYGNSKLVTIAARHGRGSDNNYTSMKFAGQYANFQDVGNQHTIELLKQKQQKISTNIANV